MRLARTMRFSATRAMASVLLAVALGKADSAHAAGVSIDDMEGADASSAWSFSSGAEFPGATGSLLLSENGGNRHLTLHYDFTQGGVYVAATRQLAEPTAAALVRLRVKLPGRATLALRVRDATGQWLQFPVARAVAPIDASEWQRVVIALQAPNSYWDGAEDGQVHQPLTALSLAVDAEARGEVWVDDVEGLDALQLALDPAFVPVVPPAAGVQDLREGFGVAVHDLSNNHALDAAQRLGMRWVRTDLFWHWVETMPGQYNFAPFDSLLARLDERGMRALFILDYGNDLYGGGPPTTAEAQAAFVAFATAAVERYAPRHAAFEVWNEPDTDYFWPPASDAAAFVRLFNATATEVRKGASAVTLVTGGLSWFDFDYLAAMLDAGVSQHADAIGVHPYRGTSVPETLAGHVAYAHDALANHGQLPIWDTEWGYSATQFDNGDWEQARLRQAVFAVRRMLTSRLVGLPLAVWYDLQDDGTDTTNAEHNFGLLTADGVEKPAFQALLTLNEALEGRSLAGVVDVAQPLLSGVKLTGPADTTLVLWATRAQAPVSVSVPEPTQASDVLGRPLAKATLYTLEEKSGPVYLTYSIAGPVDAEPANRDAGNNPDAADEGSPPDPSGATDATGGELTPGGDGTETGSPMTRDVHSSPDNPLMRDAGQSHDSDLDASARQFGDSGERADAGADGSLPRSPSPGPGRCACRVGATSDGAATVLLAGAAVAWAFTRRRRHRVHFGSGYAP